MNDDEDHRDEIGPLARYDAGLLIASAVVLFVYVLFFAFVFTEHPRLPRPPSQLHPAAYVPYGD